MCTLIDNSQHTFLCPTFIFLGAKEIFAVVKQLKQLQIKPRKNSEASTGFAPKFIFFPNDWPLLLPKTNLIGPRKHLNPELSNKTTQMKALGEYFLMVVFTLLLNRVHVFAIFMFNLNTEPWQWKDQILGPWDHVKRTTP